MSLLMKILTGVALLFVLTFGLSFCGGLIYWAALEIRQRYREQRALKEIGG